MVANPTKLIPVNAWEKHHPWPSTSTLRYYIFHAESNGFNHCIRRVGRRVLIDEAAFFEWVDQANSKVAQGR